MSRWLKNTATVAIRKKTAICEARASERESLVLFLSTAKGHAQRVCVPIPALLIQRKPVLLRLFDYLSEQKWNYVASFIVDGLAAAALLVFAAVRFEAQAAWHYAAAVFLGILVWTLYEYTFHRWLFHGNPSVLTGGHQKHHDEATRLLGMPFFTGPAIYAVLFFSLASFLPPGLAAAFTGAYALSYLYYGALHHSCHFMEIKSGTWRRLRAHHLLHHRFPDKNFGFTTTFWDRVFKTRYPVSTRSRADDIP